MITRNRDFGEPPRAEKLQDLLLSRLLGHPTDLPALHHDEEPFDIFVDLAERDEDWRACEAQSRKFLKWKAGQILEDNILFREVTLALN